MFYECVGVRLGHARHHARFVVLEVITARLALVREANK